MHVMKKTIKISIILVLTTIYFILNWLQDIYSNFGSADNGLWYFDYYDLIAGYHLAWYFSMLIFIIVAIWLACEIVGDKK